MADKNSTSSGERPFPDSETQQSKRPTATLEVEATEIKKPDEDNIDSQTVLEQWLSKAKTAFETTPFSLHIISGVVGAVSLLLLIWIGQLTGIIGSGERQSNMVAVLSTKIDALETKLQQEVKKRQAQKSLQDDMQRLATKINGMEKKYSTALNKARTTISADVDKKVAASQTRLEASFDQQLQSAKQELNKIISAVRESTPVKNEEDLKKLAQQVEHVKKVNALALEKLQQLAKDLTKVKIQTGRISQMEDTIDPVSQRLTALEKQLDNVLKTTRLQKKNVQTTALSLAFAGLKRAADRGEKFEAEMSAFKLLVPEEKSLLELNPYQTTGVPTLKVLEKRFKPLIVKALKADNDPKAKSLWGKLASNASSLIRFRRTGNIPGNTTEAILARMEYNFKKGDYKKVLIEGKALSGKAQMVTKTWRTNLEARLKLDEVLLKVEMSLLSRLGEKDDRDKKEVH